MSYIADHINTIRAVDISWYGLIYFVTAITLLWRGFKQRPFIYWQPVGKTWRWPVIPGRIPAGIFFLFACHREWDTAFNRVRWGGGVKSAEQVNDLNSVIPLTIGCLFGVWWIVRLIPQRCGFCSTATEET